MNDFNKTMKRPLLYNPNDDWSLFTQTVRQGVERHIEVDSIFHNSAFFQENVQLLSQQLDTQKVPSFQYRTYFLSHIILELIIDRLLIEHFPHFLVDFYQQLNAITRKDIELFWRETRAGAEMQAFLTILERFINEGYLWYYRDDDMLNRAIIRTYSRLKEVVPQEQEQLHLKTVTEALQSRLSDQFLGLFDHIQTQMT